MGFDGTTAIKQINGSMNAMLLLHSSCQGIIEASIEPTGSDWYDEINRELAAAEDLVVDWRQNGYLYFRQDILGEVSSCGTAFLAAAPAIDALFNSIEECFSEAVAGQIAAELEKLTTPIAGMLDRIDGYEEKLREFQAAMQAPQTEMNATIDRIQEREAEIEGEIAAINAQIAAMERQIVTDRQAIAAAEQTRDEGIAETIFGIVLAPVTGGASLILAGIGVASISEAEGKIDDLQSAIADSQQKIVAEQGTLADEQRQVVALKGLTLSLGVSLNDMSFIQTALDSLRTTWSALDQELTATADKVRNAETAEVAVVGRTWFSSACNEWQVIIAQAADLDQRSISSTRTTIGADEG